MRARLHVRRRTPEEFRLLYGEGVVPTRIRRRGHARVRAFDGRRHRRTVDIGQQTGRTPSPHLRHRRSRGGRYSRHWSLGGSGLSLRRGRRACVRPGLARPAGPGASPTEPPRSAAAGDGRPCSGRRCDHRQPPAGRSTGDPSAGRYAQEVRHESAYRSRHEVRPGPTDSHEGGLRCFRGPWSYTRHRRTRRHGCDRRTRSGSRRSRTRSATPRTHVDIRDARLLAAILKGTARSRSHLLYRRRGSPASRA